jgi:hypothetical protein
MKVPLQTEVAKYMEEKTEWPNEFCMYYANKFWNHYQAQGWKLANGNAMKDWKAAFSSQWASVRFEGDIKKLEECKRKTNDIKNMDKDSALAYMDRILYSYKSGLKPDRESAFKIYDYLKTNGWMRLTKEQIDEARVRSGNSNDNAKLWALKFFFDRMIANNLTFKNSFS